MLGPNAAAQGAQRQILLANNALAAAREEAVIAERVANASKWSKRIGKLGLVCVQFSDCNRHVKIYFLINPVGYRGRVWRVHGSRFL